MTAHKSKCDASRTDILPATKSIPLIQFWTPWGGHLCPIPLFLIKDCASAIRGPRIDHWECSLLVYDSEEDPCSNWNVWLWGTRLVSLLRGTYYWKKELNQQNSQDLMLDHVKLMYTAVYSVQMWILTAQTVQHVQELKYSKIRLSHIWKHDFTDLSILTR
jgi:hypothetical protein